MSVSVSQILKEIKSGQVQPVYVLDGEEPYFIDQLCDAFEEQVLQPHEKDFNLTILYGKETDCLSIINNCQRYPVFAAKQLILVKEAQQLKQIDDLLPYVQNPVGSTILVLAHKYKKVDGRSKLSKIIKDKAVYFTSQPVKDELLAEWIQSYCNEHQININPDNAALLATNLGNDLQKIVNEINKVLINAQGVNEITREIIQEYIGISADYNVFDFPKAILRNDIEKVSKMMNYFIANPKEAPLPLVFGSLYSSFSQLYQYHFVKHLSDNDIKSKTKLNYYTLMDAKVGVRYFSLPQTESVLQTLYNYNQKFLGIGTSMKDAEILKELVATLIYKQ